MMVEVISVKNKEPPDVSSNYCQLYTDLYIIAYLDTQAWYLYILVIITASIGNFLHLTAYSGHGHSWKKCALLLRFQHRFRGVNMATQPVSCHL